MDLLENWYEEKRSAYLYNIIVQTETIKTRKTLFRELTQMANKQAGIWEKEMKKVGHKIPKKFQPNIRTRFIGKLIQYFGAQRLRYILSAMKVRGMSVYLNVDPNYPFSTTAAHHEHRHKGIGAAGNIRAAVFGVNDGLISNLSLLLGIAGATADQNFILLSGAAGLVAGAFSMASGEYVSVRSQREFYEYQIDLERKELEQYPDEEASELAVIYHARGLPKLDAEKLSKLIISNPEKALDTLAREELGLNPAELSSPTGAAVSSFFSFAFGALIPLIPFIFGIYRWNLLISVILAAVALFSIGALLSFFTSRSALWSGLRMLLIGAGAGGITYLIGHLVGIAVH
ncbi:MAG: VIT1/CCC1 transporter family protein [Gammaproteobacteria bacterium]